MFGNPELCVKEQGTVLAEIGREIQRFFNLGIL